MAIKSSIAHPVDTLRRWRHGRGFGIHSPFAFRFVTETLRQPCAYYAYGSVGADRTLRLIVRLVVALRPAAVALAAPGTARWADAIRLADSRLKLVDDLSAAELIIADCSAMSDSDVDALFASSPRPHALLVNARRIPALGNFGMTFSNGHGTVVVASHPHLPRQDFEVKF